MVIRPEQVAAFVAKHPEVTRARVIASRDGEADAMTVKIEGAAEKAADYAASLAETLKLRGQVEVVATDSLPRDGVVIEDQRSYD